MIHHRRDCFVVAMLVLLVGAAPINAKSPTVNVEHMERIQGPAAHEYVFAVGSMSGTVRDEGDYRVPIQIHYPETGGNGTAVLELTNSALLIFHLAARGNLVGDHRSDADDLDELEAMQVNFGWAGAREYLLRNGYTYMAIQHSKAVTDFMGESPPEGRERRRLSYGRIEMAEDGYEIVRDAARWLAAPDALTGDAPPVPAADDVIAYGLSGSGYFLRSYLFRGENTGGEIDAFFVHAAGSKCLELIDDGTSCPEGALCGASPQFLHWFDCPGPPPTSGAKVLAIDAQSDLEFNAGALAREGEDDDPDYVRWEVAGAPHVPIFAMDLTQAGSPHQNPMDWSPIWRSAFHHLNRWVKQDVLPPTAPPIEGRMVFTEEGAKWEGALDADGNALGGIRLPQIEAPRGTYIGFDFSWLDPAVAKGHRYAKIFGYGGRFEPFGAEKLAERYPAEADYAKAFEAAARRAFEAGFILEEDLRRSLDGWR